MVYAHRAELDAIQLGSGSKPRLRFDVETARGLLARSISKESHRQQAPVPAGNSGGRRHQRMGSDTGLLPIRGSAAAADDRGERS